MLVVGALLVALAPSATFAAPAQPLDRVVAVVDDQVITEWELDARVRQVMAQLESRGTPLPARSALEKQLLERLILDRAVLRYAEQTGIRIDGGQVDRAVGRIAAQNKMSVDQLRDLLAKEGTAFPKFREDIRNEMILARLREREVDSKVVVTDAEVEQFLQNPSTQDNRQDEFNVSHILVTVPDQATTETIQERRARAERALGELRAGADFGQVSAAYSDAGNALQGGALGWKTAAQLPQLFVEALANLKPGETSTVLKSGSGFHVLRLNDKRGKDVKLVVTQTRTRHILVRVNELVSETDAKNRLNQLKERIENGANFAELARIHSDDPSAAKGGELGWINPGDTVPDFERAMAKLQPNQLSDPVQTPFGWHLIQVLERREQDITEERQKVTARQAIRERKSDEAYQEWLRQIRDQAYVEIKPLE